MSAIQIAELNDLEAVYRSLRQLAETLKEKGAPGLSMKLNSVAAETKMFTDRKQISLGRAA